MEQALDRTHRWARVCYESHYTSPAPGYAQNAARQALFGIVQGGTFPDLRQRSAEFIASIPFPGYAIGGLAVGESKSQMYEITQQVTELLPSDKPRYLMGVGSPEDLVEGVSQGVDMFDCVLPTRVARNGALFTRTGRVNIANRRFAEQDAPWKMAAPATPARTSRQPTCGTCSRQRRCWACAWPASTTCTSSCG